MKDLTLERYDHERHYHLFWPIFSQFWKEVNGKNLEEMVTVYFDGKPVITTKLEEKLMAVLREKTIKVIFDGYRMVGFIQYKMMESDVIFLDSLFMVKEYRLGGLCRFILCSFPNGSRCLFHVHKKNPPIPMLTGMYGARKVGDSNDRDLELWEFDIRTEIQGKNPNLKEAKESEMDRHKVVEIT